MRPGESRVSLFHLPSVQDIVPEPDCSAYKDIYKNRCRIGAGITGALVAHALSRLGVVAGIIPYPSDEYGRTVL